MKIAFVVGEFPALSQTFVLNQITGLIDRGHEVDIYAEHPASNDKKQHSDIEHYGLLQHTCYERLPANHFLRVLKSPNLLLLKNKQSLLQRISLLNFFRYGLLSVSLRLLYASIPFAKNGSYDIIHCHFGSSGEKLVPLRESGIVRGKIITSFHSTDLTTYPDGKPIYNRLFERGDLFLPISDQWKRKLIEIGCPPKKTLVHHMGVDCLKFPFVERPEREPMLIVTVARLVEMKGLEFGIRAVSRLLEHYPDIRYHIAGDGPLAAKLARMIEELNISNRVKLLGGRDQDEIRELLQRADLYLHPSVTAADGDHEGIPVALMEAMASGLPVVATDHCGIPELVQDGVTGLIAPEKDVQALAERLSRLMRSRELRVRFGSEARNFVDENYNVGKLNDTLVKLFEQTLISG